MAGELRRIRMYRAMSRPFLFMGGERELMIMLIVFCVAIIFAGLSIITTIIGVMLWLAGILLLRTMAKRDPQMTKVFLRYWNFFRQPYYPATARPTSRGHSSRKK